MRAGSRSGMGDISAAQSGRLSGARSRDGGEGDGEQNPDGHDHGGEVLGTLVPSEPTGATAVSGVWVAGNVGDAMAQVVSSAAAGLRAGAMVNADLIEEETQAALSTHRAELADLFEQPGWDDRYAARDAIWSGRVNPQLAAEAADLEPGMALDVGSGEGADAIWLAERGWSVTGIDFSTVALERSAAHAATAGVDGRTEWRHVDVRTFDPGTEGIGERWDLVTSQFMHLPDGGMVDLTRRLAEAVAPGGTLLVVGPTPTTSRPGCDTEDGASCSPPRICCPRSTRKYGRSRSSRSDHARWSGTTHCRSPWATPSCAPVGACESIRSNMYARVELRSTSYLRRCARRPCRLCDHVFGVGSVHLAPHHRSACSGEDGGGSVVLDFGCRSPEEWYAIRSIAELAGARFELHHLELCERERRARSDRRWRETPNVTFQMTDAGHQG